MNKEYAQQIHNGRDMNRVPLYTVVPLKTPFSVSIGVSDFCNFKCIYCTHSLPDSMKNQQMLTWDRFVAMISQIEDLYKKFGERAKNFSICGVGEPLTHKRLPEMIQYIRERNISDRIELTTNASLLTTEIADQLIDAGLTRLIVSVQGITGKKYQEVCGYDIDFDKFIDQLRYFYQHKKQCSVYAKIIDIALENDDEKDRFYSIFSPVCDTMCIENILKGFEGVDYDSMMNADTKNVTRYGFEMKEKKCCDSLFMRMNISVQGEVNACACQWPPLVLGNINRQPLTDIWNGELHKKYMMLHLEGKRKSIPRCLKCESMASAGCPEDNLDEHLLEILERVRRM